MKGRQDIEMCKIYNRKTMLTCINTKVFVFHFAWLNLVDCCSSCLLFAGDIQFFSSSSSSSFILSNSATWDTQTHYDSIGLTVTVKLIVGCGVAFQTFMIKTSQLYNIHILVFCHNLFSHIIFVWHQCNQNKCLGRRSTVNFLNELNTKFYVVRNVWLMRHEIMQCDIFVLIIMYIYWIIYMIWLLLVLMLMLWLLRIFICFWFICCLLLSC